MLQWMQGLHIFFQTLFLFSLNKYPGFEALCHMAVSFLIFWGTSTPFPTVATPIYSPTDSAGAFSFQHPRQHLLLVAFWITAIVTGVRWHLIVVLICIALMIRDAEHLFMGLLAICMLFSEKCLFRSSAQFLPEFFFSFFDAELYGFPGTFKQNIFDVQISWIWHS